MSIIRNVGVLGATAIAVIVIGAVATRTALTQSSASLQSDSARYAPGTTATLTGAGFQALEPIQLSISIDQPVTGLHIGDSSLDPISTDALGGFVTGYVVPDEADGMMMRATAVGEASGLIATTVLNNPAWVDTNLDDYPPGASVYISGGGFLAGETVELQVVHVGWVDGEHVQDPSGDGEGHDSWMVQADENGDLVDATWYVCLDDCTGALLELRATGVTSTLTASARFADANPCDGKIAGASCDDGNACTTGETCQPPGGSNLTCKNGTAVSCDDSNACTTDSCNQNTGCAHAALSCDDNNVCTIDSCDTSTGCAHAAGNAGTACRTAGGECDQAETCTGSSATCPADIKKDSGTACTADSNPCTLDQCSGTSNSCQHPAGNAGAACTDDGNPCTLDRCNGTSTSCQHPAGNAGVTCRTAGGECDLAESCTGTSTTCPSDAKVFGGTACTSDGNPCTLDQCNGSSNSCQHPAGNAGAACSDDGDPCTSDACDGASSACQHPPGNAGAVCRAAASECDLAETCPGASIIGLRAAASASSGTASSATSLSIGRPAGTLAGDVMLATITAHDGVSTIPTITAPEGWTLVLSTTSNGQDLAMSTYYKVAGTAAADPGPYGFSVSPAARIAGGISGYFNVDTTNPINASDGAAGGSAPSITTTVYGAMLVACFGRSDNQSIGAPSGLTERFHAESASGTSSSDAASESAGVLNTAPGATGSKASTSHNAQVGQLIALAPPSSSCPADTVNAGAACTDDGNPCTTDICSSSGACAHQAGNAGAVCRAAAGSCDVTETCTGTSVECPADGFEQATTSCTGASEGGVCDNDAADHCSGASNLCVDVYQSSSTVCRASAGQCDVAETCTGSSGGCPADGFASNATSCVGASQGAACDNDAADHCTGTDNSCVDSYQPGSTVCRGSAGQCDVAESCTGSSGACPADGFASITTSCVGASQGAACDEDAADHCTGTDNSCVDVYQSSSTVCRASAGQCDVAETCTGSSGACPADGFASSATSCVGASQGAACDNDAADHCTGTDNSCVDVYQSSSTVCRASAGQCDVAETCTGSSGACPADGFASSATSCVGASQGAACDNDDADHCTGTDNSCVDSYKPSNAVCRGSAGQCDVAESCTGSSGACPADGFASSATACVGNSQVGACDINAADHCTGTSNACVDVFRSAGYTCRGSAGQCDVAETCTGSSGACPADGFASTATPCVGSSQDAVCDEDAADHCTGTDNSCVDVYRSSSTVCRATAGQCDVAETCTGSSGACPADGFASSATACVGTSQVGACDNNAADHCTGTSNACVDVFRSAGYTCRGSAGQCDVAETCTGSSGACPSDGFASTATPCVGASQGAVCDEDAADHCTGTDNSCVDVYQSSSTVCRATAGQCDVAETCTGSSGACPSDGFASSATACVGASQIGACDNNAADHCTGTSNACVDVFRSAGDTCRGSAGQCDVAETCTGSSGACPSDGFASSATACVGASQSGSCDNNAADRCTGTSNACVDAFRSAGYTCRGSAGQCDVAETCSGSSGACPADGFASSATACVGASQSGSCDNNAADRCTGTSNACVDAFRAAGYTCRGSAGQCDVAETCSGSSGACPSDGFASSATACVGTSQGGACDNNAADRCTGTSNACVDAFRSAGYTCRGSAGQCDVAETCTGSSGACPSDGFASSATACVGTSQGGACDNNAADRCTGTSNACVDAFRAPGYTCRGSAGQCDLAETCSGSSGACPSDGFASSATACAGASQGGSCDNDSADHCTGVGNSCVDVFRPASSSCPDDGDSCTSDLCSGTSATCAHACIPVAVDLAYTGDYLVWTAGPTVSTGAVVLSAHLVPQTSCQSITGLTVRFRVFSQNNLLGTPVSDQIVSVNSQGDAVALIPTLAVGQYTVRANVQTQACWGTDSDDACLTVDFGSTERRVTGGGWVPTAGANGKSNFGFTVGYNKNGTLKGNSIYMVRGTDGFNYLVKSNAWNNGSLTFSTGCNSKLSRSRYTASAVIQKIDPLTGLVVSSTGNCTLVVDLADGDLCSPRQRDQYAIRVILPGNADWWGSSPTLQDLGGGNTSIFSAK